MERMDYSQGRGDKRQIGRRNGDYQRNYDDDQRNYSSQNRTDESNDYELGWNNDGQSSSEQSRRRLSAGSERPYNQQQNSQQSFYGRGPKGYQRSDERIQEEVCDCLFDHPGIDASEIEVRVEDGQVTLSGTVNERRIRRLAEEAVEDIRGVKDVSNQIRVQSGQEVQSSQERSRNTQGQTGKGQTGSRQRGETLHA